MKRIVIEILPDGEVKALVDGHKGPSCVKALEKLLQGLGTRTKDQKRPDYHVKNTQKEKA